MDNRIYLDNNATTRPHPSVVEKLGLWADIWGNPSSVHKEGRGPKTLLRESRKSIADMLGVHPLEVVFTSGGTESNNIAIKGIFYTKSPQFEGRNHYLLSAIEHPCTQKSFDFIESQGAEVERIPVLKSGVVDLEAYAKILRPQTRLVSCMLANNETGVIQPLKEMVELAHKNGTLFHSDAVQGLGKMDFTLGDLNLDLASFSGHKFYALKGAGVLYVKKGTPLLETTIHGGGQERARRGGTENTLAVASLAEMSRQQTAWKDKLQKIESLRNLMEDKITQSIDGTEIVGQNVPRVCNTSNIIVSGVDGETLLMNLDMKGVSVSTGSACSSGSQEPSPVLRAMGLTRDEAQSSLRLSLGIYNTEEEIVSFCETLKSVVEKIRSFNEERYVPNGN